MKTETCPSYAIRLYLSGPIEVAKQTLRAECLREGLCVTIEPTIFIYTGGEEAGYVVGLVNYPRFPTTTEALRARAQVLMAALLDATHQHSALMVTPNDSVWITKRAPELATAPASSNTAQPEVAD
jgi:ferredoxin